LAACSRARTHIIRINHLAHQRPQPVLRVNSPGTCWEGTMKDFAGKTAVVTGAASGMGLAFAHRFAEEGMNVVAADIESEPLAMAEAALKEKGGKVLAVRTNVL